MHGSNVNEARIQISKSGGHKKLIVLRKKRFHSIRLESCVEDTSLSLTRHNLFVSFQRSLEVCQPSVKTCSCSWFLCLLSKTKFFNLIYLSSCPFVPFTARVSLSSHVSVCILGWCKVFRLVQVGLIIEENFLCSAFFSYFSLHFVCLMHVTIMGRDLILTRIPQSRSV